MPTYVYEIVGEEEEARTFEMRQRIHDASLTHDPETGKPVRRVISGGIGFLNVRSGGTSPQSASTNCCHGCHD